jgi:hypothetical protein
MVRPERCHFIVKHGLDSLKALPNYIWRSDKGPDESPRGFDQVKLGDRWIAFAYTNSDRREQALSKITGFYECTREKRYAKIPLGVSILDEIADGSRTAWLIEGKQYGEQPREPAGVRPIDDLIQRPTFKQATFIPITADEFNRIRNTTLDSQLNTETIPLLGREPQNEQELLSMVVHAHKTLGIEKIFRVRKAFPDLLVKIDGSPGEVHLELELYSKGFLNHGHSKCVADRSFKEDGKPLAVLCWIDNADDVKKLVHKVYELRQLIRQGKKLAW